MSKHSLILSSLRAAFPLTIPIMAGYFFLGFAHGILMSQDGFSFLWPAGMAVGIFGGSLEYYVAEELLKAFAPLTILMMTLIIQSRHIFYSISMLEKYRDTGLKKCYLIFGLTDETFSINCSATVPSNVDRGWFYFFVTILNQFYWVFACTMGGIFGQILKNSVENINRYTNGLDFVMTALFAVILLEQLLKEKKHYTALIGAACSLTCLLIFGAQTFLLPTLLLILFLLAILRKPLVHSGAVEQDQKEAGV